MALLRRDRAASGRTSHCSSSSPEPLDHRALPPGSCTTGASGGGSGWHSRSASPGLAVIVEVWTGLAFDTLGIAAAFAAAFALAAYVLMAERKPRRTREPGLALVLRFPLRGALLGPSCSRSGRFRGARSASPSRYRGRFDGSDRAPVAAGRVRGRGRDDDHVLAAHGGSPAHLGDARLHRRDARARRRDRHRLDLARRRPSARRSSSAARSFLTGILLAQTAR